jgi:hypothetical protein
MTSALDRWLTAYARAWGTNSADDIGVLFTEDAEYRAYPWGPPVRGRDEIVEWWRSVADGPDDHRFSGTSIGADGNRHFVQGRTVYDDGRTYENLWIVDLDEDGRASAFTEWYMESDSKELGPKA